MDVEKELFNILTEEYIFKCKMRNNKNGLTRDSSIIYIQLYNQQTIFYLFLNRDSVTFTMLDESLNITKNWNIFPRLLQCAPLWEVLKVIKGKYRKVIYQAGIWWHIVTTTFYTFGLFFENLTALVKYKLKSEIKQISVRWRSAKADSQPTYIDG